MRKGKLLLIRQADVYAPEHLGVQDILVSGEQIMAIGQDLAKDLPASASAFDLQVLKAEGRPLFPGYIDQHLHAIGGGGEAGPYSRTPEVMLTDITTAGVTTVIGVLGTDGTTRHLESLLAKVRALQTEGITAYMLTGSYEVPVNSLTGDPRRDMILIDKVLGIGEIALSDHRSSQPTLAELKRIVTQARVGGMLAGKAGVVQFHLGVGKAGLDLLFQILAETEIPARHLIPTHINRIPALLDQGLEFARQGGYIDLTSGVRPAEGFTEAISAARAMRKCLDEGVPMNRVTMSSDGNGSMAVRDEQGQVVGLLVTKLDSLHDEIRQAILAEGVTVSDAVRVCTQNVAEANGLWPRKGQVAVGADADLLLLDEEYRIDTVIARGQVMVQSGEPLVKGTFE